MHHFFAKLQGMSVSGEEDRVMYIVSRKETFSAKSLYALLEMRSITSFPTRVMWNPWAL